MGHAAALLGATTATGTADAGATTAPATDSAASPAPAANTGPRLCASGSGPATVGRANATTLDQLAAKASLPASGTGAAVVGQGCTTCTGIATGWHTALRKREQQ